MTKFGEKSAFVLRFVYFQEKGLFFYIVLYPKAYWFGKSYERNSKRLIKFIWVHEGQLSLFAYSDYEHILLSDGSRTRLFQKPEIDDILDIATGESMLPFHPENDENKIRAIAG